MCKATIEVLQEMSDARDVTISESANPEIWQYQGNSVIRFIIGEENPKDDIQVEAAKKADQLEHLIRRIYGTREDGWVPISNIRLFTLVFLFDWSCMIRGVPSFTSAQWLMGRACAYPLDYNTYFERKGDFEGNGAKRRKNIWRANSRVLFQISFDIREPQAEYGSEHQEATESVLKLLTRIASKYGVDFSVSKLHGNHASKDTIADLTNEFSTKKLFRQIDEDLLNYVLARYPFLNNLSIGQDLNIAEYAKRHHRVYLSRRD